MRFLAVVLVVLFSFNGIASEKARVREVRKILKDRGISESETCLDEYLVKRSKIIKQMTFGALGGGAIIGGAQAAAAAGLGTTSTVAATGAVTTTPLWPFASVGAGLGLTTLGAVTGGLLLGYEAIQTARLVSNGYLIKAIYEGRKGSGRNFDRLYRRFDKKYGKNFVGLNKVAFSRAVLVADKAGLFCLKKPLRKKKVLDQINDTLQQQDDPNKCGEQTVLFPGTTSALSHRNSKEKKGWAYQFHVTASQIKKKVNDDNMRPVDLEKSNAAGRYNVTFVRNSGENKVNGHWWVTGSIKKIMSKAKALNGRIIDLDLIKKNIFTSDKYSALIIGNNGKHAKDWALFHNMKADKIKQKYQKCGGRIVDLTRLPNGKYSAIVVKKRGVDNVSWWWKTNRTYQEINQFNKDNGTRIVDLHSRGNGRFDFVVEKNQGRRWKYTLGKSYSDLIHMAGQEKMRITDIEMRIKNGKKIYDAVLVQHANELENKIIKLFKSSLLNNNPGSYFGFYLKEVDGPVLASVFSTKNFYPASTIKAIHKYGYSRMYADGDIGRTDLVAHCGANDNATTPTMRDSDGDENDSGSCPFSNSWCPQDQQTEFTIERLAQLMMENSNNRATQSVREVVTQAGINKVISDLDMDKTTVAHRVGCGSRICIDAGEERYCGGDDDQVVDVGYLFDNQTVTKTTLKDMGKLWGSIAKGDLEYTPANSAWSGTFVFRKEINRSVGTFNIGDIYDELEPTMDTSDPFTHYVKDKSHIYQKAGSTTSGDFAYLSRAGEMMISHGDANGYRIEKNYVFGVFHHGLDEDNDDASSDTLTAILTEMAKSEIKKAIKSFNK